MSKQRKKNTQSNPTPKATAQKTANKSGFLRNSRLHLAILAALAAVLYANTLGCDYTWDDAIVITDNDFTKSADFGNIFTKDTFHGFFKQKKNLVAGGRYRPLTLAMFAVEYQITESPFLGHLMNIFWYALIGIVLYLVLLKLINPERRDDLKLWFIPLIASLLFVAHPIHTEAVSNIKGRDEIITLLGALAALYFALRAYYEENNLWMLLSGLVFFLGLLAKENAITFLAVVPLAFYFFTKADFLQIAKYTLPLVVAAVVFLMIRFSILGADFGTTSTDLMNNPFMKVENGLWVDFTLAERFATIMFTLGKYLQLLVVPFTLTHDYYPRQVGIMSFADWRVILSLLVYVGMGVYALIRMPKRDVVAFGILFFLITLSIVSNIVFPIGTNMSERFMFMPSVGFALVMAALLWRLADFLNKKEIVLIAYYLNILIVIVGGISILLLFLTIAIRKIMFIPLVGPVLTLIILLWDLVKFLRKKENESIIGLKSITGLLGVILFLFSVKTIHRNLAWKDNFTLFSTDIKTSNNSAKLLNAMGGELTVRALSPENANQKNAMLTEAIGYLKKAVEIHPTYANAYLLLGNAHNYSQQYESAIEYYKKSEQYKSNYKEAMNNMAITYRAAAISFLEEKKEVNKIEPYLKQALSGFERTQNLYPDYPGMSENIGLVHRTLGRYHGEVRQDPNEALIHLERAQKYTPNDTETLRLMSLCYGLSKQTDKMIVTLEQLIQKQPDRGILYLNLATAYAEKGDLQKAEQLRQKAYQLQPNLRR